MEFNITESVKFLNERMKEDGEAGLSVACTVAIGNITDFSLGNDVEHLDHALNMLMAIRVSIEEGLADGDEVH